MLEETLALQEDVAEKKLKLQRIRSETAEKRFIMDTIRHLDAQNAILVDANKRLKRLREQLPELVRQGKADEARARIDEMRWLAEDLGLPFRNRKTPTALAFLQETYVGEKRLQDDARRHMVNYVRTFAKIVGDKPLADYTRADIINWVRTLEKLKASLNKSPKDADKSVAQLLRESRDRRTMNATTIEKHITHVKGFFRAAARHHRFATRDEVDEMFEDIALSSFVPGRQKRKTWSIEQLNALFASPIWAGTASAKREFTKRHLPGSSVWRDAYWWLPVLALWTGARLEELAQLHHEDLIHDSNGIPYIRIHDEGKRRVKTPSSVRNVPVHSALIRFGILEMFDPGKRGRRIFPELKPSGRLKKLGDMYSTHFTDYRRRCGLYEPLRDFHSLRRTFITAMRNKAEVDALTVAAIAGHDDEDEAPQVVRLRQTDDYTDYDIGWLKKAIERLDYEGLGLDVSRLLPPAKG